MTGEKWIIAVRAGADKGTEGGGALPGGGLLTTIIITNPFLEVPMSLWDKLKGEFIDIIEWTEPTQSDILCYRFPRFQNEIKMGAKLTVREGQAAVFVNEGRLADVFRPGLERVVPALAEAEPDGMDRRQVEDIHAQ